MKTAYILLVILSGGYSGNVLTTHSFQSKEACQIAKEMVIKRGKERLTYKVELAECVPDTQGATGQ